MRGVWSESFAASITSLTDIIDWSGPGLDGPAIEENFGRDSCEVDRYEETVPETDVVHANNNAVLCHLADSLMQ